jgi:hypothetical protein
MVPQAIDGDNVLEHVSKPLFLLLAAFIVCFYVATAMAVDSEPPPREEATSLGTLEFMSWAAPYIHSRPRKVGAVAIYAAILAMQLVEVRWVSQTLWRTWHHLSLRRPDVASGLQTSSLYVAAVIITFVVSAAVVSVGLVVIGTQLCCVCELFVIPLAEKDAGNGQGGRGPHAGCGVKSKSGRRRKGGRRK